MQVLSYGFKNPDNGDKGSVWFPALNFNIVQLNNHTHDGITSAQLAASSLVAGTVSIPSTSWALVSTGKYSQTVTVPSGFSMDGFNMQIRLASTGHYVYPTIEKVNASSFTIYTNDNTQTYTAVFR